MRAPTPSRRRSWHDYDYREVKGALEETKARLFRQMMANVDRERMKVKHAALKLKLSHPRQKLLNDKQYAAELENRLKTLFGSRLEGKKHQLASI